MHSVTTFPALDATVTPPKTTDISRVTMTLPMVIAIVGTALTMNIVGYLFNASDRQKMTDMQSEIRNIRTLLNEAERVKAVERENLDLRLQNMRYEFEKGELRKALLAELAPKK